MVAWSAADIPDQHGRTAVVTGANGGLGLETARQLAAKGAHVVMAVRNQKKAAAAVDEIRASVPDAALELVALDLASQASVRAAAEQIVAAHKSIDLLINNAGVMGIPEAKTVDGFEMQLGVDHLGHWSLTALLLPALLRTPGARIVTVTSTAHHMGRAINPANPHLHGRYRPWRAYGQAKLANFHFGLGLQRELENAGASTASLIAHPGLSNTDLQAVSVQQTGGGHEPAVLALPRPPQRDARGRRRAVAAAGGHRPGREGRRVLRPAVRQQRAAGAQAGRAQAWHGHGDRRAVGGLRARDRNRDRPARGGGSMTVTSMDRAAAVRSAMRTLVARNGFHGASMSAVASEAGVATGTAYTHYASKDELVLAAYCETKAQLAAAAMVGLDAKTEAGSQFRSIWLATYRHLKANPGHARFLLQVDHSPYRSAAHQAAIAGGDPLAAQAAMPDVAARLLPLPLEVIYELGLSPAVRLAAGGTSLTGEQLDEIAGACWRAISLPD